MSRNPVAILAAGVLLAAASGVPAPASVRLAQSGQTPPAQDQAPPKAAGCIAHTQDFTNHKTFEIELSNGCERAIRCTLHVYVVTARGPAKGRKTLRLAPKSAGAPAKQTYVLRLKENDGEAHVSRSCRDV